VTAPSSEVHRAHAIEEPLEREAEALGRYLLGSKPSAAEVERYVRGSRALFPDAPRSEAAVVAFALRRRWALPLLDGACGLVEPDSLLRRKLILMLAILETSPGRSESFEPITGSRAAVLSRLFLRAARGGIRCIAGLAVLPLARRSG
jgi:hypothetical protein